MAESLIEQSLRRASRPCHVLLLGDIDQAAQWKHFALRKRNQLLATGRDMPMSQVLQPDENTTIRILTGPVVDIVRIEVGGGLPHGIVSIPCTSLSPLGFGVPLLGSGDEWGSSGVDNPEAYDPPVTHPANGRAYQLAFMTTDGKGQVVPETKIPEVKHGSAWAGIVGKQKISDAGEKSDLRYGGPEGVAVYLDAQKKKKNVFSLNNKRMVWGIYPVPGMAKLYMNGQAANAYIQLGENEYLLSNAVSLGLRGNTLILLCYIQDGYGIFTAEAPKKIKDKVVFVQCGDAIHLTGMLTAQPNFLFNKSGTRCSAVIPFPTTPTETDTKVVHIDLDDSFAPTLTIVPPSAPQVMQSYLRGYYYYSGAVGALWGWNGFYHLDYDRAQDYYYDQNGHHELRLNETWADISVAPPAPSRSYSPIWHMDTDGYEPDLSWLVEPGEYTEYGTAEFSYQAKHVWGQRRPAACGYKGDEFILVEFEEKWDSTQEAAYTENDVFWGVDVNSVDYQGNPIITSYITRSTLYRIGTAREYDQKRITRSFLINGEYKCSADSVWYYHDRTEEFEEQVRNWPSGTLPYDSGGMTYYHVYGSPDGTFDPDTGAATPEWYIYNSQTNNVYPYGYDLHNNKVYATKMASVLADYNYVVSELGYYYPKWYTRSYDVGLFKNDTRLHTIFDGKKPI